MVVKAGHQQNKVQDQQLIPVACHACILIRISVTARWVSGTKREAVGSHNT